MRYKPLSFKRVPPCQRPFRPEFRGETCIAMRFLMRGQNVYMNLSPNDIRSYFFKLSDSPSWPFQRPQKLNARCNEVLQICLKRDFFVSPLCLPTSASNFQNPTNVGRAHTDARESILRRLTSKVPPHMGQHRDTLMIPPAF